MTGDADKSSAAIMCRRIVRSAERATLATTAVKGKGGVDGPWAYASLVLVACDYDASPLLLISDLADHTTNLRADPRVALLYDGTAGLDEPLTGPRVSLQGRAEPVEEDRLLERYLRRYPSAERYAGFRDFHLFRIRPMRAHIVAGFGKIEWLEAPVLTLDSAAGRTLAGAESGILAQWHEAHADLIDLYARGLLSLRGRGWRAIGLDQEGVDIRRRAAFGRIEFRSPVATADEALADLRQRVGLR